MKDYHTIPNQEKVDFNLIHNACMLLQLDFGIECDSKHFKDPLLSNYHTAHVNKNKLVLSFPVVASPNYAEASFNLYSEKGKYYIADVPIRYNNALKFEYNRVNGNPLQQNLDF